jgi:hypothetical protein
MKTIKYTKNNKITNNLTDNLTLILHNSMNYKHLIENTLTDILNKFVSIIIEFTRFISEKVSIKNKQYYKFIFEKGIDTLTHVFTIIFYYTKNLELTFYHSQKAYYFYIEFIEQISDDSINFLHLSSRDAIMFVYKKTIFEINNEYKKHIQELTNDEKKLLSTFNTYTNIYRNMFTFIINHNSFDYNNKIDYINTCCNSIKKLSDILNKIKVKPTQIQHIYIFSKSLEDTPIETYNYFYLLNEFINKITNIKKIDENIIKTRIYDTEINNFINNNEINKIIGWIFSNSNSN